MRIEQGTLPGVAGNQHYTSSGADSSLNQPLSPSGWPWVPGQTYYVRFVNSSGGALPITFTMKGRTALTDDEDEDGLPDAWENAYFAYTGYGTADDNDGDGIRNLMEWAFGLNPTVANVARLVPGTGTTGLPAVMLTGSGSTRRLVLEYVRRKNVMLTYTAQFASAPGAASWQTAANAPVVTDIDAFWERVVVEDTVTVGEQPRRFGRVLLSAP